MSERDGTIHDDMATPMPDAKVVWIDLDATLTDDVFRSVDEIPAPTPDGERLLHDIAKAGLSAGIFTGRVFASDPAIRAAQIARVDWWIDAHDLRTLLPAGVWPWPKPYAKAFVDDRAVTWRGHAGPRLMAEVGRADQHCRCKPRVLLISPLSDRYNGIGNYGAPALGVWRLRANMLAADVDCDVWDCNTEPDVPAIPNVEALVRAFADRVKARVDVGSYDWIGFSILNDTLPLTLGLANLLKREFPKVRQCAGNAEATLNYQDILDKTWIDCVLVGEADHSFPLLAHGEEPRRIDGCIWFSRGTRMTPEQFHRAYETLDWGGVPWHEYWRRTAELYHGPDCPKGHDIREACECPTYRPYLDKWLADGVIDPALLPVGIDAKAGARKLLSICTVRLVTMDHCFLPCTYCSTARIPDFATGGFQRSVFLGIEAVKHLLLKIKREVKGVLTIYDDSDETFLGTKRGLEYAQALLDIKPTMDVGCPSGIMSYLVQTRSNEMTRELVEKLARAGVRHLTFGVENASAYVRDSLRKRQDDQQLLDLIDWCVEFKVTPYYLMILFPPDTRVEDVEINVRVVAEWIRRGAVVSAEPYLMPYRGTPILDDPRYTYEHVTFDVPFSGTPGKKLKWPTLIWPRDPAVRGILLAYRATLDDAIRKAKENAGHNHTFKGWVGKVAIEHLGRILDLYNRGVVKPWNGEDSGQGKISPVLQEYFGQESGATLRDRTRAEIDGSMQSPVGRFNPSHQLIDVGTVNAQNAVADLKQGASKVRAQKDPAAPGEVIL